MWLKRALISIIFLPIFGFVGWYSINFLPHLKALHAIEAEGRTILGGSEDSIYPYALAAEGQKGIRIYAIQNLYVARILKAKRQKMLWWRIHNILWYFVSFLHFNDKEIFHIWAVYAPYENGRGLAKSANYYFNKDLASLNPKEIASIVVVVKSPSLYKPGGRRFQKRVTFLMEKVKTYNH